MKKIDFHVHHHNAVTVKEAIAYFRDMMERKGYCGICVQSFLHHRGNFYPDGNQIAMEIAEGLPDSYAFAGLDHNRDFVEQTKEYMAQGFRGIKLLEGKPSEWRANGGLNYGDPRFDAFFAYCEAEQIPILIHNNDPLVNWDITKADARAIEQGWVYDETVPSQEWFFEQLENALLAHPNLRVALAHFGFYADNLPRAELLMEACPNLYMDITPAICIFPELSRTPEASENFFRKYHTRIFYGTDADSALVGFAREYNDLKTTIITHFLEGDTPKDIEGRWIHPIRLEREMLENIYYNNAMRFMEREP